jgi:hypothetical protein
LHARGAASLNIEKALDVQSGHDFSATSGASVAIRGIETVIDTRDQLILKGKGPNRALNHVPGGRSIDDLLSRGGLDLRGAMLRAYGKIL